MTAPGERAEYLSELSDGTLKQINPFTGTEVWTVPGRGHRPIGVRHENPEPVTAARVAGECAFCPGRYLDTPPEKSRLVHEASGWRRIDEVPAAELFASVAEFRRVPNLFEILSFAYWHLNHGFELPRAALRHRDAYLATPEGRAHVLAVVAAKLRAGGASQAELDALPEEARLAHASGFFGGGHDIVIARRHFVDAAGDDSELASSGTLTPEEHAQFISFTVDAARAGYDANPSARYVVVFQNWLKPAGASFDHLHKQLVAIDEVGAQHRGALDRLRANPNVFNDAAAGYAARRGLVIASNTHAVAFAGFGHRYPCIEVYSTSEASDPWDQDPAELRAMSDLIHAMHAATGAEVACNEEWHYRPPGISQPMPWRVMLKWRVSTLAGFEGATKIYLNTIGPGSLRDRVVTRMRYLREQGLIAPDIAIADEAKLPPNPLRYRR